MDTETAKLLPLMDGIVLTGVGQGRSYSEIGTQLGMTKQGVHKIASAAMQALRVLTFSGKGERASRPFKGSITGGMWNIG